MNPEPDFRTLLTKYPYALLAEQAEEIIRWRNEKEAVEMLARRTRELTYDLGDVE